MKRDILTLADLFTVFAHIMEQESIINPECSSFSDPGPIYIITKQLSDLASKSRVVRCRDNCFDLANDIICTLNYKRMRSTSALCTKEFFGKAEARDYKNCGFYTAIIVMSTLIANGEWYSWREKQYTD